MTCVRDFKRAAAAAAIAFCALVAAPAPNTQAQEPEGNYGVGIPDVFLPKYLDFRTSQLASGTPNVMRVKLGYVKGLSTSFTSMVGEAASISIRAPSASACSGLSPLQTYTVSLVDRSEPTRCSRSAGRADHISRDGADGLLKGILPTLPLDFAIDRVVVRARASWGLGAARRRNRERVSEAFFRRLSLLNESSGALHVRRDDSRAGALRVCRLSSSRRRCPPLFIRELPSRSSSGSSGRGVNWTGSFRQARSCSSKRRSPATAGPAAPAIRRATTSRSIRTSSRRGRRTIRCSWRSSTRRWRSSNVRS